MPSHAPVAIFLKPLSFIMLDGGKKKKAYSKATCSFQLTKNDCVHQYGRVIFFVEIIPSVSYFRTQSFHKH